jgi:hypothetical protein
MVLPTLIRISEVYCTVIHFQLKLECIFVEILSIPLDVYPLCFWTATETQGVDNRQIIATFASNRILRNFLVFQISLKYKRTWPMNRRWTTPVTLVTRQCNNDDIMGLVNLFECSDAIHNSCLTLIKCFAFLPIQYINVFDTNLTIKSCFFLDSSINWFVLIIKAGTECLITIWMNFGLQRIKMHAC